MTTIFNFAYGIFGLKIVNPTLFWGFVILRIAFVLWTAHRLRKALRKAESLRRLEEDMETCEWIDPSGGVHKVWCPGDGDAEVGFSRN